MAISLGQNWSGVSCQSQVTAVLSGFYKYSSMGEIVLSSLAVIPNILLISIIWRVTVLPVNLRLLLGQFNLALLWLCLGNMSRNVYLLIAPRCAFTFSQWSCRIFDFVLTSLASSMVHMSLLSLCAERAVATVIYKKYDKTAWHNRPYLAVGLIMMEVLAGFGFNAGRGLFSLPTDRYVPICERNFMPRTPSSSVITIYLSFELVALSTSIFIYFYNRYMKKNMAINRARYVLSARFMIDQNVQINAIIAPAMIMHSLIFIPTAIIYSIKSAVNFDRSTQSWLSEAALMVQLIYASIHPILVFCVNTALRRQLLYNSWFGRILEKLGLRNVKKENVNVNMTQHGNDMAAHFQHLDNVWAMTKPHSSSNKNGRHVKIAWADTKT